jgi:hypothetical protein
MIKKVFKDVSDWTRDWWDNFIWKNGEDIFWVIVVWLIIISLGR